ncbi:class I SAM-dependent methyltransferase [Fontibacillus sp. BL9]|uniref:class I SAM-dependent methyltransferase n=1 Tax=Fontibacillus sp. BL9 TaxID=3389971 RepID=UPI003979D996
MERPIKSNHELLDLLDRLFRSEEQWWDEFYEDREREIPFFVDVPDENLVSYFERSMVTAGNVLELGTGPGRNAIYMAEQGCKVDAVDLSANAIKWGKERASEKDLEITFMVQDVFSLDLADGAYDLIYDSGLLHHLLPHRRFQYIELVNEKLKPGGHFGLVCFAPGFEDQGGAAEKSDSSIYKVLSMQGGAAYSKENLEHLLSPYFELVEIRPMKDCDKGSNAYGKSFLWASLWRKKVE